MNTNFRTFVLHDLAFGDGWMGGWDDGLAWHWRGHTLAGEFCCD